MSRLTMEDVLAEEVGHWFDVLAANDPTRYKSGQGCHAYIAPTRFRRILPFNNKFLNDDWCMFGDATPRDVDWPIDVCAMTTHDADFWCKWTVKRFRSVSPKQVRGIVTHVSKYMLVNDVWIMPRDDHAHSASGIISFVGGTWVDGNQHARWSSTGGRADGDMTAVPTKTMRRDIIDDNRHAGMLACGLAFNRRYEWGVELSLGNESPSFFLPTDPTGIRLLFAHRDRNPRKDRRDVLLHWVRRHMRRMRKDPSAFSWVRKHIRGSWGFEWYGMNGVIHPAQFDLEQIAKSA